jgi:hypothetical protein
MERPTTAIERDPQRIDEYLAWYQNGTLSDDDRQWVESCLEADPALRERLAFDEETAQGFETLLSSVPADIGWSKLQQRIRADVAATRHDGTRQDGTRQDGTRQDGSARNPAQRAAGGGSDSRSLSARLFDWIDGLMTPQLGAALAALVVIQTVGVGYLIGTREQPAVEYRSLGDARPVMVLRVLFDESITERRLRDGLTAQGATIVDGPNALGEYWIATRGDPTQVAKALQEAGLVASFVVDQRVAPR